MKTLYLLRHAKAEPAEPFGRDFDRRLAPRGVRDAARVGAELARRGARIDRIVTSPAVRAFATARGVAVALGYVEEIREEPSIYEAFPETLLELIQDQPDTASSILLVGHNPGMEQLAASLARSGHAPGAMPTGAVAALEIQVDRWTAVGPGSARLAWHVTPRELDAS